jgi:hypothetical protein
LVEPYFLASLELHDPPVVDYQLDRALADRVEGLPKLLEERRGERQPGVVAGIGSWVFGRTQRHDPIYPI